MVMLKCIYNDVFGTKRPANTRSNKIFPNSDVDRSKILHVGLGQARRVRRVMERRSGVLR